MANATARTVEQEINARLELSLDDLYESLADMQYDGWDLSVPAISRLLAEAGYVALVDGFENWVEDHRRDDD